MIVPTSISKKVLKERDEYLNKFKDLPPKELFLECKKDPAVFAYYMMGVKLYAWQWMVTREIVRGNKRVILDTSRQIGKSFLVAVLGLWFQMFNLGHSSQFNNTKIGIVSATENQAKKLLLDVKNLMRIGDAYCQKKYDIEKLFTGMIDNTQGAENTKTCITFMPWEKRLGIFLEGSVVGGFIKSLPPTDVVRGETFDFLIVDEAAMIDDEIYNSAISKTGDKFDATRFITSTPRGRSGFYYEYFDPEEKLPSNDWKRFWFTVEAIKLDDEKDYNRRMKDIGLQLEAGKALTVRQEYYGDFVQAETSFFNPKKVDQMIQDYEPVESYEGLCDLGVDFGGLRKSRTVLTISCLTEDGKIKRLYHHAYEVREDASIMEDIQSLRQRFNIQRIIVDDCPEGDYKIREMEEKGWEITRMQFARDKVRKFGDFRSMLNRNQVISYHDADLIGEMKALAVAKGRERTKIQPPPGYSDDHIDSFVMSSYHYSESDDSFKVWDWDKIE